MKYLKLYETHEPEIASEWQMRRAAAGDLLTLPQFYAKYLARLDLHPSFGVLVYYIWKNLSRSKEANSIERLVRLGLLSPSEMSGEQLSQLPGMNDIVLIYDSAAVGSSKARRAQLVNTVLPGLLTGTTEYDASLNWSRLKDSHRIEADDLKFDVNLGHISEVDGPNGKIPILFVSEYFIEAWVNINDLG